MGVIWHSKNNKMIAGDNDIDSSQVAHIACDGEMMDGLNIPPTEVEVAELLDGQSSKACVEIIRRLAFQRDALVEAIMMGEIMEDDVPQWLTKMLSAAVIDCTLTPLAKHCDEILSGYDTAEITALVGMLIARIQAMRSERAEAVRMAKELCRGEDWDADWQDNLHMADIIEKRIYNMAK